MYSVETVIRKNKEGKKVERQMVFGTGRLVNDPPEVREFASGAKLLAGQKGHSFSIAFDNGKGKKATFYRIEAWGRIAENLKRFGFKGQEIEVAAQLKTDKYKVGGVERTSEVLSIEKFDVKQFKDTKRIKKDDESSESKEDRSSLESTEHKENQEEFSGGELVDMKNDEFPF